MFLSLLFAVITASAFVVTTIPSTSAGICNKNSLTTRLHLYQSVEQAISEAQRICAEDPSGCPVMWDIVEELEAADSHRYAQARANNGPADQSMDFVALMTSFDILTKKIDGKMDQLIATCDKFEQLGADPSVAELSRLAKEMKYGMSFVKNKLSG